MSPEFGVPRHAVARWIGHRRPIETSTAAPGLARPQTALIASRHLGEARTLGLHPAGDAGFTLIELMVVLLILAILLAIAIPTFLGVTKSANDRAVQSNLSTAFVNAKAIFQSNSQSYVVAGAIAASYSSSFAATLLAAQPNLSFIPTSVTGGLSPATISVAVADANGLALAEQAKGTNNCWYIFDNSSAESWTTGGTGSLPNSPGTWYGVYKNAGPNCSALSIPAPSATVIYQQGSFPPV